MVRLGPLGLNAREAIETSTLDCWGVSTSHISYNNLPVKLLLRGGKCMAMVDRVALTVHHGMCTTWPKHLEPNADDCLKPTHMASQTQKIIKSILNGVAPSIYKKTSLSPAHLWRPVLFLAPSLERRQIQGACISQFSISQKGVCICPVPGR